MKSEYEVVVIGSGYGGSIAASRMARAGRSVCLLEKGREYLPGDFPETTEQAALEMNATTQQGHHLGRENGLYTFEFGEGINVFRGCGLGGTSLVNANVSIEADKRVFEDPLWPAELRVQGALDEGYRLAREMLNPSPYPSHFPKLPKLEAL
ncbi:MAG: FAD-dependent oxidoreductase, partial [Verrucomicrobiales bacterium]